MLCSLLLCAAIPLPALAQPHVIAQLGTAPLIGQIASTPQLQSDVALQRGLFERAGTKLGLSAQEYAAFAARIASRQLAYVTIPRHLDAMSWSSGGNVYVVRDVVIPAGTKGWEIDLQEDRETVALFVPSRCGNLSIVRRPRPLIARAAPRVQPQTVADAAPPQPASSPQPVAMSPVVLPQAPAATPAPYQTVAVTAPPATHHPRLWPLLLLPLLALAAGHHGGSLPPAGTSTLGAPPPPASCPTPAPSH